MLLELVILASVSMPPSNSMDSAMRLGDGVTDAAIHREPSASPTELLAKNGGGGGSRGAGVPRGSNRGRGGYQSSGEGGYRSTGEGGYRASSGPSGDKDVDQQVPNTPQGLHAAPPAAPPLGDIKP